VGVPLSPRIVESDYNGYAVRLHAERGDTGWRPMARVTLRLGYAVVPKPVQVPGIYATEEEALDFAIGWVRQQIDSKTLR
jgi:hypothetical protein